MPQTQLQNSLLKNLAQQTKQQPQRIIFPEQNDPRVQQAAKSLLSQGICKPLFLSENNLGIDYFWQHDNAQDWFNKAVDLLLSKQKSTEQKNHHKASQQLHDNAILLSTLLVTLGYADGGVAGSIATTGEVLKACFKGIGLAPNTSLVSSVFLMVLDDRVLTYGDCAVNPNPTAQQLAQIAIDSAASHQALTGETPKVALLSFSSKGSAKHPDVSKVINAFEHATQLAPDLLIDGELQFDSAIVPDIAKHKAADSSVAGQANVFIFPTLDAGNIAYKITERLAGATAIGPILQGLNKPWLDLSRGCSSQDIIDAAVITSIQALSRK